MNGTAEFRGNPPQAQCKNGHGDMSGPSEYDESTDSVIFLCMMCDIENEHQYVSVDDFTDDAVRYFYRKTGKRVEAKDSPKERDTELASRLREELEAREMQVPDVELEYAVVVNKRDSLDLKESIPGITMLGEAVGDTGGTFDTPASEIEFRSRVTAMEKEWLEDNWDGDVIRVEEL